MPSARRKSKTRFARTLALALIALLPSACGSDGQAEKLDRMVATEAEAAERGGDTVTAIRHYGTLYESDRSDAAVIEALARNLRHAGQFQPAWSLLAEALTRLGPEPRLLVEKGKVEIGLGRAEMAVPTLQAAVAAAPEAWEPPATLAIALDRLGRYDEAATHYAAALALNPGNADALNNFALSRALSGRIDEGIDLLRKAAAMASASPRTRENLAFLEGLRVDPGAAGMPPPVVR